MKKIVGDGEMWRRRKIDGSFMALLKENETLIKYSLDISDEESIKIVYSWIEKLVGTNVTVEDCPNVDWKRPDDDAGRKELKAKDYEASARRLRMDIKHLTGKLDHMKGASEGGSE